MASSHVPERTCIASRRKTGSHKLVRVVVDTAASAANGTVTVVVPDPDHRLPGRGAWLTPSAQAYGLAVKKRAFNRAFKVSTPVDASAVLAYLESRDTTVCGHEMNNK
ncbi:YlxR family protein [Corynebacterium mendelii]|uniref:YlxR family protein n=1 Tax=Corynebacterium mendelii TaxID=2765362 RepID=A0A939DXX7_9CORY|nr:YlxR family protein [Corynebacterium mendelii]MBN9643270.1 YlxR family protein [Corynebacterium mendelii]